MAVVGVLTVQDRVALVEIELCGELMIAAAASLDERLSQGRIDEVLLVRPLAPHPACPDRER
ncbi:hypothetical protein [Streptomyces sp. NBC_00859]|uniref:hypothetical protein n=1 Tax=Streptomyces sp. NBC_00859 TaxID=2903682 RepID=UPI003862EE09|nr:hypothetical protein OG584_18495 [Streptomyces sp. NBC_00859]